MQNIQNAFKHHKARKQVVFGGLCIMISITILSCVSSFLIYREGFRDVPYVFQQALAGFAVVVVEGCFIWLVFGISKAFSSAVERLLAFLGLLFIVGVMLLNIVTHFQIAKGIPLSPFQQEWVSWGAVSVFVGVLVLILAVTLADPVARLVRLELRYLGKQQETILGAKSEALDSDRVQSAMVNRANTEAEVLAQQIEGESFPAEIDARSNYRSRDRERLEIIPKKTPASFAQEKDITKTHESFNSEGLTALRQTLKDISFRLAGTSFKSHVRGDVVWIRAMKARHGTQETVSSARAHLDILNDAVTMAPQAFRERLERFLRKNGFEI